MTRRPSVVPALATLGTPSFGKFSTNGEDGACATTRCQAAATAGCQAEAEPAKTMTHEVGGVHVTMCQTLPG